MLINLKASVPLPPDSFTGGRGTEAFYIRN